MLCLQGTNLWTNNLMQLRAGLVRVFEYSFCFAIYKMMDLTLEFIVC